MRPCHSLGHDLAEHNVRRPVQPAQVIDAVSQLTAQATDDPVEIPAHIGVQATKVGNARGRAHSTQKP